MRIVFMGTPDFAVESLKALIENNYNVVGVITMPDKPAGRGHKMQHSAVKEYAITQNLPLLQPEKLKDEEFLSKLKAWNADIQVVVAFRMLPEVVWNMPPMGTFNLHASLLPQYRGAAPINWAIINGETETGATTFFLTHEIDTGKVILQEKISIAENDNAGTVHDRLMFLGAHMVTKTIDLLIENNAHSKDQSLLIPENTSLKKAPKIFKETCQINLTQSTSEIYNFVRGLSPYPGAWIEISLPQQNEKTIVKVFDTEKEISSHNHPIGEVVTDGKNHLKIATNDGYIHLKSIQVAGKKRMNIGDFLRGLRLQ